ncbi:glycosyltransferase [Acidithiobacillus ferriphilus]|uniref:glycosyltransferase n=1 Tax=Acidithiobacillus ferriphilus TaxID=1689834 RepID=UPI0040570CD1
MNPEPFGRVIVEGMPARRPVVASAAGGVLEIIEDVDTGLLYPPGDGSALRAQIDRLQNDPALCEKLGVSECKKSLEYFSMPAMINDVNSVITEVCPPRRRAVTED